MICSYLTQNVCEWNTDILCTYFCKKEEKDVQISGENLHKMNEIQESMNKRRNILWNSWYKHL